MILQTYPFANDGNYVLSNTTLAGDVANLALVPNTGQIFQQTFSSDSGFTYDSSKAEFTGGLVRQKSQEETPTIVSNVGLTVVSDTLEKTSGISAWDAGAISSQQLSGDGYVKFKPSFANKSFGIGLSSDNPDASYAGIDFLIVCGLDGNVYIYESNVLLGIFGTYNALDTFKVESNSGVILYKKNDVLLHTSVATPTFPLFMDCSFYDVGAKAIDIRINTTSLYLYLATKVDLPNFSYTGVGNIQAVESSTFTEVGAPRYIVGGKYWNGFTWATSNNTYSQASSSATVIANLTSLVVTGATSVPVSVLFPDSATLSSVDLISVTLTGQKYPLLGYVEPAQAIEAQDLLTYEQTVSVDGDTSVRVIVKVDGQLKYWDGAAWEDSDGTEAQSNTAADINTNFTTLVSVNSSVYLRWLLITTDQTKTPSLIAATIGYDFGAVATDPQTCIVYGYVRDLSGAGVENVSLKFHLVRDSSSQYVEAAGNVLSAADITVKTDEDGYFECPLVWTSEFEGATPGKYQVQITKGGMKLTKNISTKLEFDVPDATTKDITDLITVA